MKITGYRSHIVTAPADNPLVVGLPERSDTREFMTLALETDEGLVGLGVTFFGGALTGALKAAVNQDWGWSSIAPPWIATRLCSAVGTGCAGGYRYDIKSNLETTYAAR
jgi:hypothetical protein